MSGLRGFTPVMIGYGHAGRDLHHSSLRQVAGGPVQVLAVDPVPPGQTPPDACWVSCLEEALTRLDDIDHAVFHVTTPVDAHEMTVERLAEAGARHIVLEKPVAGTVADSRRLAAVARSGVDIVPVSVWLASTVTAEVEKNLANGDAGIPLVLHMEQSKPRFQRTDRGGTHRSALQVEMPHQLLLALHLAGSVTALTRAATWPMEFPDGRILPDMGGCLLTLTHTSGMTSTLVSDLTSPVRIRRLRISGSSGEVVAYYPISREDDVGQIQLARKMGRTLVRDAPLTQFLDAAYRYFATRADPPLGNLPMHLEVVELLEAARLHAVPTRRDEIKCLR